MRKQLIYILIIVLSSFFTKAQGGWKRQYFLQNTTAQVSWNVVECPNGNFIVIGITYDNQYCTLLTLVGTDSQGNELWRKDYGNCGLTYINFGVSSKAITDTNAFYISAEVRDTNHLDMDASVLIKFNYQGDTLWQRKYISGQSNVHLYVMNLCKSVDGGILLGGFYVDNNSPGGEPTIILKTDINGNELWRKIINKPIPNSIRSGSVVQDSASKNILLTGLQYIGNFTCSSLLVLDSLGNKLLHTSYSNVNGGAFGNIVQLKDKNFVTGGQWAINFDNLIYSPLIVKFDNSGNLIWSKKLGAGYVNGINMVCELQNGDLVGIAVMDTIYYGSKKLQFVVLNSNGEYKWSKYIGSLRSNPDTYTATEGRTSTNRTSDKGYILSTWFLYSNNNPYSIIKLDSTGCDTLPQDCREIMTGIEKQETEENGFKLYPNPNSGEFFIETEQDVLVSVLNILGQIVRQEKVQAGKTQVDLSTEAKGIYFVEVKQGNKMKTVKVIKQE